MLFLACNQQPNNSNILQTKLAHQYKFGFGEFMSGIQAHYTKLWFAGKNKN